MDKPSRLKLQDGRMLAFSEYGDHRGTPILYFHGWPASRLNAAIYDSLGKKHHIRIIAPDRPGFGFSTYKNGRTLLDWAKDITALADYLKIRKFAVLGVSGGGPYAAVCAYRIPQMITRAGIVVGLAPTWIPGALDGIQWIGKIGWQNYRHAWIRNVASRIQEFNSRYVYPLGLNRFLFSAKADQVVHRDPRLRERLVITMREAFRFGYRGPEQDLKLYTSPWQFRLSAIRIPVYLWYGSDDKNVSLSMGKYYASEIPKSSLVVYQGEGHLISVTHAEEIFTALTS